MDTQTKLCLNCDSVRATMSLRPGSAYTVCPACAARLAAQLVAQFATSRVDYVAANRLWHRFC